MADPVEPTATAGDCKGCRISVRLAPGEVERILAETFRDQRVTLVDDPTYAHRLATCQTCPDLLYGTTCRHCGCLVAVRAKLAEKACPALLARWPAYAASTPERAAPP